MLRQIKLLTRLQLINLFGLNEARHAPSRRRKREMVSMAALFTLVALMFCAYVGLVCYGLVYIGLGAFAPLLLALVVSLVILVFTMLRAGGILFDLNSYERLISMPLRPTAIIVSRFLTMYIFDAALALLALLPGTIVCGALMHPAASYYPMMLLGALVLPLIPMTVSMLLGAAVYALSARMRHKNLAVIALSMALLVALMGGSFLFKGSGIDLAQFTGWLDGLFERLSGIYPPAGWFARSVNTGNPGLYALLTAVSVALFTLAVGLIGRYFRSICTLLNARAARGGFRLTAQRRKGVGAALLRREWKRYFASPTYVMNTLTGALMALVFSAAIWAFGARNLAAEMLLSMEQVRRFVPLVLALMFLISPTTCSAISMEVRQFWLIRSLPVHQEKVYAAKIEVNLLLMLPFWLLSEVMLLAALRPRGAEAVLLVLLPLGYILYGSVLGLWFNIQAPMLNWESDRQPVKQSRAVMYAMLAGFFSVLLPGVALWLLPGLATLIGALVCALTLTAAAFFWLRCRRIPLWAIE